MIIKNQTLLLQLDESQTSVLLELLRAGAKALAQPVVPQASTNLSITVLPSDFHRRTYYVFYRFYGERDFTFDDIKRDFTKSKILKLPGIAKAGLIALEYSLKIRGVNLDD